MTDVQRRTAFTASVTALSALLIGACSSTSSGATTSPSVAPVASGVNETVQLPVTFAGGHDTNPVDSGRPVVLVASLLGVEPGVFRTAFSGVTPAPAGEDPQGDQVQKNKAALLSVLGPYGVTNEELDAASNDYRYVASAGELWNHRDATALATVEQGRVTAVTITDPGRGYTSAPTATITLPNGATSTATVTVSYTTDFETNGSLAAITP
jgi:hypothetical protein